MITTKRFSLFIMLALLPFAGIAQKVPKRPVELDKQAHRGGSGLMPENSIPAMLAAIDLGVNTLEMDLHITKDNKVIVSHNPILNYKSTTTPDGRHLTREQAKSYKLYEMPYDSIRQFDIGMKPNPEYPDQKKIKAVMPLFTELIAATEAYAKKKGRVIHYNVEVKSRSGGGGDGIYHPAVGEFVDLVMADILKTGIQQRCMVQSFDVRALKILHQKYPEQALSYLYSGQISSPIGDLFAELGFTPEIFSPIFTLVNEEVVSYCRAKNVKVIAWTPNKADELKKLRELGVDGIITDYPNLFDKQ
ncbi:MAG: glycerophosphodiester phosphodiesterase family protein [Dyadobacter fermentans]